MNLAKYPEQPWLPADATNRIRQIASGDYELSLTKHAREQMESRELVVGDVNHILKFGFVYDDPEPSTRESYFKYKMECSTPNSGARTLRLVVIPSVSPPCLKIITIMWKDGPSQSR